MKKALDIKPIPKYITERIRKIDMTECPDQKGPHRWYSYLTKIRGDLVKITVVTKTLYGKWHCKQVLARGVKSKLIWVKDMAHHRMAGYLVGWNPEGYKQHENRRWYADGEWWEDDLSRGIKWNPYSHLINPEYAGKFKEYSYSGYLHFKGDCMIEYLKLYLQYPQIEYLMLHGLGDLHNKVSVLKRIENDKKFCRWLVANKDEIAALENCYAGSVLKAYKTDRPVKLIQKMEEFQKKLKGNRDVPMLQELFGKNLDSFYAYIAEQNTDPFSYIDYIKACKYLRLSMNRKDNLFPADFQKWHDRRIDEYKATKARADAKNRAKIYKQFAQVSRKYLVLQKDCKSGVFTMMIATSPADLIHEGEQLHHCVGKMSYEEKMAREETLIFFVRSSEQINTPFVTVEYSPATRKVLQCYGYKSKRPDDNVLTFVNKVWLPYANRTMKKFGEVKVA